MVCSHVMSEHNPYQPPAVPAKEDAHWIHGVRILGAVLFSAAVPALIDLAFFTPPDEQWTATLTSCFASGVGYGLIIFPVLIVIRELYRRFRQGEKLIHF